MPSQERLAPASVRNQIERACLDDTVHLSGLTQRYLTRQGIPRTTILDAMVRHIQLGHKIHIKVRLARISYDGNLWLDDDGSDALYFEARLDDARTDATRQPVWLQVHEHDTGYKPLSR